MAIEGSGVGSSGSEVHTTEVIDTSGKSTLKDVENDATRRGSSVMAVDDDYDDDDDDDDDNDKKGASKAGVSTHNTSKGKATATTTDNDDDDDDDDDEDTAITHFGTAQQHVKGSRSKSGAASNIISNVATTQPLHGGVTSGGGAPSASIGGVAGDDVANDNDDEDMNNEFDREAMRAVLATFNDDQHRRYEAFRRGHLNKATVKKIIQSRTGAACGDPSAIVVQSAGKLFVGELTELARDVMEELGDTGPILPHHLREAHRRLKKRKSTPAPLRYRKRLF